MQELYLDVQESHREAAEAQLASTRTWSIGSESSTAPASTSPPVPLLRTGFPLGVGLAEVTDQLLCRKIRLRHSRSSTDCSARPSQAPATGQLAEFEEGFPRAFVLAHLLLALFWVYDTSPGQERTRRLLDRGFTAARTALPLVRLLLLRRPPRDLLALIAEVKA